MKPIYLLLCSLLVTTGLSGASSSEEEASSLLSAEELTKAVSTVLAGQPHAAQVIAALQSKYPAPQSGAESELKNHTSQQVFPHLFGKLRFFTTWSEAYLGVEALASVITDCLTVSDLVNKGEVRAPRGGQASEGVLSGVRLCALLFTPCALLAKEWKKDPHVIRNNKFFFGTFIVTILATLAALSHNLATAHWLDQNSTERTMIDTGIASLERTGRLSKSGFLTQSGILLSFRGLFQLMRALLGIWISNIPESIHGTSGSLSHSTTALLLLTIATAAFEIPERQRVASLHEDALERGQQILATRPDSA